MADPRKAKRPSRAKNPHSSSRGALEAELQRIEQAFFTGQISREEGQRRTDKIRAKLNKLPSAQRAPHQHHGPPQPTEQQVGLLLGTTLGLIGVGVVADVAAGI